MESAGKRAAEARAKMNRARVELVELPEEHAQALGVKALELRAPSMRVSSDAFNAEGFDTLGTVMSAMVWLPAEGDQPAEQLWPTPADVGAVATDASKAVGYVYTRALALLQAGREASPKG